MLPFRLTSAAHADLDAIFAYLASQNLDVATRFFEAFWNDALRLAFMPGMGAKTTFRRRDLRDLRSWPIKGFQKYLIFYKPVGKQIRILRVVHGARDIPSIFEDIR